MATIILLDVCYKKNQDMIQIYKTTMVIHEANLLNTNTKVPDGWVYCYCLLVSSDKVRTEEYSSSETDSDTQQNKEKKKERTDSNKGKCIFWSQ